MCIYCVLARHRRVWAGQMWGRVCKHRGQLLLSLWWTRGAEAGRGWALLWENPWMSQALRPEIWGDPLPGRAVHRPAYDLPALSIPREQKVRDGFAIEVHQDVFKKISNVEKCIPFERIATSLKYCCHQQQVCCGVWLPDIRSGGCNIVRWITEGLVAHAGIEERTHWGSVQEPALC